MNKMMMGLMKKLNLNFQPVKRDLAKNKLEYISMETTVPIDREKVVEVLQTIV